MRSDSGEVAHHDLEALAARASKCHLCLTVFMSIDPEAYRNFRRGSTQESVGFAWISPIARDQARLKFRYVRPGGIDRESSNGSSADLSLRSTLVDGGGSHLERGEAVLAVELILMNPKCKCPQKKRKNDRKLSSSQSGGCMCVCES